VERTVVDQLKRKQFLAYMERGVVMIHLDPRVNGVDVPPHFRGDAVLRLNIAYGFNLPALTMGDDGIYAILSFNRQDYACTIPWHAIFGMTLPHDDQEGVIWPEAVPPELASLAQAAADAPAPDEVTQEAPEAAPFVVLDGGQEGPTEPTSPPKRNHLKIVKE